MGGLSMIMLAKDKSDFPKIRDEHKRLFDALNKEAAAKGYKFLDMERPYTQEVAANTPWANMAPDMASVYKQKFITFLILLMRRREEIGVRRAFGAKRSEIIMNLFMESLVITVIAGLIGLGLSLLCGLLFADSVFTPSIYSDNYTVTSISVSTLFHWSTFGWAMLFCFILNLLSAALPSINASKVNIVNAISGKH